MKKLVAFAAVIAAVSFASCSSNQSTESVAETAEPVVIEDEAPAIEAAPMDSVAVEVADSAAVEAAPAE